MKLKSGVFILLLAALVATAQTNNLTSLLQQGLFEEQANRNLDRAIANYQSLASQYDKDRQLAATAVFRLGECYRAQGKTNEAAAQYQRMLHDFPDQPTLSTLSRQNLTGMGMGAPQPAGERPAGNLSRNPDQIRELAIVKKLQAMPLPEIRQVAPTLLTDATLINLIYQYNECELDLLRLRTDHAEEHAEVKKAVAVRDGIGLKIKERLDGISNALTLDLAVSGNITATSASANTPSVTDAEDQEIQRIQTMIQNSPDLINAPGEGNKTPLAQAATKGWRKVAAYLIEHGADVNGSGGAALAEATSAGNRAMVELLLSRGADVNSKGWNNKTPLQIAAQKNFPAVIVVLLTNKADVNAPDNKDFRALDLAAASGQVKIVQTLLAAGANPNLENKEGRTALSYATEYGSPDMVKMLLAAKADANGGHKDAPLLTAIYKNNMAAAEMLLQAGADPNLKSDIHWQMRFGNEFYPDGLEITPLFLAIINDQLPIVQLLLKFKADPNDTQMNGRAVIFNALGYTDILKALLDAGANVEVRDETDSSASGGPDTFQNRLNRMTNPDLKRTPLLFAAAGESNVVAVAELLQHGANPNACDGRGNTPLHWAAKSLADEQVFTGLLECKANPNIRNIDGKTPLDLVKERLGKQMSGSRFLNQDQFSVNHGEVSPAQISQAEKMIALLRQHGALDNLPDWDRITISRPSAKASAVVFQKNTNDWNHFTLLETLLLAYPDAGQNRFGQALQQFPDLKNIVIVRPSSNGKESKRIPVNLLDASSAVDCSRDLPLEFGDVVEIPEREHTLAEVPTFLTRSQFTAILDYFRSRAGQVKLVVAGSQTVSLPLQPMFSEICQILIRDNARAVLTSKSDLSHIKVIRGVDATGKNGWILDCSQMVNGGNTPDLWLRNGDVIEVPEKP